MTTPKDKNKQTSQVMMGFGLLLVLATIAYFALKPKKKDDKTSSSAAASAAAPAEPPLIVPPTVSVPPLVVPPLVVTPVTKWLVERNTDYPGNDIECGTYDSADKMASACVSNPSCKGYSFNTQQNKPWCMKSDLVGKTYNDIHDFHTILR